ncbi:uncharacterized protein LOC115384103 [Salarias fasciatus]|uniref:uncharacterized protein LOC115384103 n=1 Tax=Salarias fasciatus TaxID=181472 RepID=UPI00117684BF|nr:uncharacterized protein LOC115384103 [Salarias fasciatus]
MMAAVCQQRRVLVEIPAPQAKIPGRIRRSYSEALSPGLVPSPLFRGRHSKRAQSLDLSIGGMDEKTPLSTQQLVQLIRSLIMVEQSKESRVAAPDLRSLQEDLQQKKANVYRSIPYSRFGSNRDAHCYRKAYPHLLAFKVSCQEWGQVLLRSQDWDGALEHALMAWRYTSQLPQWDTAGHNALREQCYRVLAAHALAALQHHRPDASRGRELLRRLSTARLHSQSIVPCIKELQRMMQRADDSSTDEETI